jgi:hypothetical protein
VSDLDCPHSWHSTRAMRRFYKVSAMRGPSEGLHRRLSHQTERSPWTVTTRRYRPVSYRNALTGKVAAWWGQNARLLRANVNVGRSHVLQVSSSMRSVVVVMIDISTWTVFVTRHNATVV